jgi:hypothetical protein
MARLSHEKEHRAMSAEAEDDWGQNTQAVRQVRKGTTSDKKNQQRKQHHRAAHPHADVNHL